MNSPRRRVFVTGIGALSPVGLDAESTWRHLLEGRSGIAPITQFDCEDFRTKIAGEVKGFEPEKWLDFRDIKKTDRFTHFAVAAARMAVTNASLELDRLDRNRIGVAVGSGIGGIALLERQHELYLKRGPRRISPFFIPGMILNLAPGFISIELGLRGPNSSVATACATGNHAIGDAFRMIQYGDADAMLAGGTESAICPMAIGGFGAMKALSTRNDEPEKASRPFDSGRDGFVIAEGCGVLVLESEEHARRRGARLLAEVRGFGMSADAYHISAPAEDGNGMIRVMRAALADAGMKAEDIDYVNAHGTSTPTGDGIEAKAVETVFADPETRPLLSSTKSMTGHLLGAAGGLESVISVLAVQNDQVPPTINLDDQDEEVGIDCVAHEARAALVRAALSNSFGFGGTNATLIFCKPELHDD